MSLDPRIAAFRPDLADAALKGKVEAERFVNGTPGCVIAPSLPMRGRPDKTASYTSELMRGEQVTVFETADGCAWVQNNADGYVGYVEAEGIGPAEAPTHLCRMLETQVYAAPELKLPPLATLPFLSAVRVVGQSGKYLELSDGRFVFGRHVEEAPLAVTDWVAVAERFLGRPYIWGGRTPQGLDCSALVQLARMAAGHTCPRDSDMQEAEGTPVTTVGPYRRGDLVFWPGHVGIMVDERNLLHANAFHMAVTRERLELVADRIHASEGNPIRAVRRFG